ncbi:GDSL-type esterase/lipase family protein [Coraliomargarita algicola]|uniref:GDSL-type esterase/lipase family protein n=1 Tax=Coraliomargarita algicola TaxID=3092156 RepID=A0ABZ0RQM5_9BACT|nr:GDSL-type esterase/lipase family protein [Coraliomargarita sp. J2-16]WPJ97285.1 GDSL-type esterase/lipase family protein [Coraliomargarita sp. J2-16]
MSIPRFYNADLELVRQGYHVVLAPGNVYGHPSGNATIDAAYDLLTTEYGFSKKCNLASMSRETLALARWAYTHSERVDSLYIDNGVCSLKSWPGGKSVPGSDSIASGNYTLWGQVKDTFGWTSDAEALAKQEAESLIGMLAPMAAADISILMVCGDSDPAVPYEENDAIVEERYKALGGSIEVIVEKKGHSHGMKAPAPVIEFIKQNTSAGKELGAIWFIGDSITQSVADGDPTGSPRKSLYDLLMADGFDFSYTGHFTANVDGLPTTGGKPADNLYHYHSGVSGIRIGEAGGASGFAKNLVTYWNSGRLAEEKPDTILIMLGTNDVATPVGATDRLRSLVEDIYSLPDVGNPAIYLASIPPNRRNASDTAYVAAFNAEVPGIVAEFQAEGKDVHFVDQFTALDDAYASCMRRDNLHPNATGNEIIAQTWFDAISAPVYVTVTE